MVQSFAATLNARDTVLSSISVSSSPAIRASPLTSAPTNVVNATLASAATHVVTAANMRSPLAEKNGRTAGPSRDAVKRRAVSEVSAKSPPKKGAPMTRSKAAAWRDEQARLRVELEGAKQETAAARDRAGRTYALIEDLRLAHERRLGVAQERVVTLEEAWEARERAISPEKRALRADIAKAKSERNGARAALTAERAARDAADAEACAAARRFRDERVGIVETQRMIAEDALLKSKAAHAAEVAEVRKEAAGFARELAALKAQLADASEAAALCVSNNAKREAELWDINTQLDEANVALEAKYAEDVGRLQALADDQRGVIRRLEASLAAADAAAAAVEAAPPPPRAARWPKLLLAAAPAAAVAAALLLRRRDAKPLPEMAEAAKRTVAILGKFPPS